MSNLAKMQCLDNYIQKYNTICGKEFIVVFLYFQKSTSQFKEELINEILENRIILGDNFNKYLELVCHRIKKETNFIIEDHITEEWRIKYNLKEFNFYPINIEDCKTALYKFGTKLDKIEDEIVSNKDKHKDYEIFEFHFATIEIIHFANSLCEKDRAKANYKNEIWFKFGVLFATGKMEEYYDINQKGETTLKNNYTAPKVAEKLGNLGFIKAITATINNYDTKNPNGAKNIFNSLDKMEKIILHCKENNIEVIPYFISRLPPD